MSQSRPSYFVVFRRYLRRTKSGRKSIIKYLRLPEGLGRVTWITDPTKASHFNDRDIAFKVSDERHGNVTLMSETA